MTRRNFIKVSAAAFACATVPAAARAALPTQKQLYFCNIHTRESLATVYWKNGAYDTDALAAVARVLRDHRTGEVKPIDVSLLDTVAELYQRMGSSQPFEVISGYRSPRSNAMLHETTSGVAVNSLHMIGKAIDIRMSGKATTQIRDVAWNMQKGGVGYYHASDFVHVDVGNVRRW